MVIIYILNDEHQIFSIGEKKIFAQQAMTKTEADNDTDKGDEDTDNQDSDNEESMIKKRKSYINDLLFLPKINTTTLKKDEISRYLNLIERKTEAIKNRMKSLKRREKKLKSVESMVNKKIQKLEEEVDFFKQTVQQEKDISEDRLEQLVTFYKKMSPKKAAPVFEKMDRDLVVALFKKIPQKQTTEILSLMTPDRSVEISEYYGRIKSGKEYDLLKEINQSLRKEFIDCGPEKSNEDNAEDSLD